MAVDVCVYVSAAELDGVHHERGDLVEGDPIRPPGGKREDLIVRGEAVVAEAAEQPHHGEVELAMAAVGGRVDQPATPLGVDEAVASPEITVQPRRSLDGTTDVAQPTGERPQPIDRRWRQRGRVGRQSGERQQATRAVKLGPRRGGIIRQRPAPRRAAVLPTEARCAARCRAASRRPRSCSVTPRAVPRSIHDSTSSDGTSSETASTDGTSTAPASRIHASPAASVEKNPDGGARCVLTNTRRPSTSSTP